MAVKPGGCFPSLRIELNLRGNRIDFGGDGAQALGDEAGKEM